MSLLLGASLVSVSLLLGGAGSPAFADTAPYGSVPPVNPRGQRRAQRRGHHGGAVAGQPERTALRHRRLPGPAHAAPVGRVRLRGPGCELDHRHLPRPLAPAGSAQPLQPNAGPFAFAVPIPSPVPSSGLSVDIPPSPASVGGFFASPETIPPDEPVPPSDVTITLGGPTLTISMPSGTSTVTCANYPNDAIATSGITTQAPVGTPTDPIISQSTPGPPNIGAGPFYVAVGDSVPMWNGVSSYPYDIASNYFSSDPNLEVVDLACRARPRPACSTAPAAPLPPTPHRCKRP